MDILVGAALPEMLIADHIEGTLALGRRHTGLAQARSQHGRMVLRRQRRQGFIQRLQIGLARRQ